MRWNRLYSGKYLSAAQLERPVVATIEYGEEVVLNDQPRIVIHFQESDLKPLALNKTNAGRLEEIMGSDELDDLPGAKIELYVESVNFQGKMVDSVRIRPPKVVAARAVNAEEDVPF